MFELTKNKFVADGYCHYEDEHKNTAFMRRNEKGFVAKIRFANKLVTAEPVVVHIPLPDDERGQPLHLTCKDENDPTVDKGIENFVILLNHWISLLNDIKYTECPNALIAKELGIYEEKNWEESVCEYKMNLLYQYPELETLIKTTFEK